MAPRTQFYGKFFYKNIAQLVIVTTEGDTITNIRVSNGDQSVNFTLEMHNPDVHGDKLSGRYDSTNKLHVNALIHVYTALNPDAGPDGEVIGLSPYFARPDQDWPNDERILYGKYET